MPKVNHLEGNISKIGLMHFLDGLWFPLPVCVIYLLASGITLTQFGLLLGASTMMQFILDIPSSIWADRYSRRSVLIGAGVFFLLSDIAFFFAASFGLFLVAFCLSGISNALTSGISSALTYDTLLSLGREKEYEKVQAKVMKSFFLGRVVASLGGAYLYLQSPRLVFVAAIVANLMLIAATLTLQEPPREKSISKSFRQIRQGVDFLLQKKQVWYLIIIFSLMLATCDTVYSYYQPALQAAGIAVADLGIVYFFVNVLSFCGAGIYERVRKRIDWKSIMAIYLAIGLLSSLCFSTQSAVPVILAILLLSVSFGTMNVYISGIIHRRVPSTHRATTLSIQSQMYMLFYAVIMSAVGFSTDHSSIFYGMILNASLVFLIALSFFKIAYAPRQIAAEAELD